MTDMSNTPKAPTAAAVLDQIVEQFGPKWSLDKPWHDPKPHARRRLTVQMLQEAYGQTHPLSGMADAYNLFDRNQSPSNHQIERYRAHLKRNYRALDRIMEAEMEKVTQD